MDQLLIYQVFFQTFLACAGKWKSYKVGEQHLCFLNAGKGFGHEAKARCENFGAKVPLPTSEGTIYRIGVFSEILSD